MILYFDLDKKQLVNQPGTAGTVRAYNFTRGDYTPLEVHFFKGGEDVTDVTGIVFVIKASTGPSVPSLAIAPAADWELVDGETYFTAAFSLNGEALDTLLGSARTKALLCQITCYQGGVGPITSQLVTANVSGDLYRGDEAVPGDLDDPEAWLEERRPAPLFTTGVPINGAFAHVLINPTGSDNSFDVTAVHQGAAGNDLTLALSPSGMAAAISVTVSGGENIAVSYLASPTFVFSSNIYWDGVFRHSKPLTANTAFTFSEVVIARVVEIYITQPGGAAWTVTWPAGITWAAGAPGVIAAGTTIKVILTAIGLTTFTGSFTTGATVPTASTAAEVIAAINAATAAAALVTAVANGTVTGVVSAVTATALTGGIDPVPAAAARGQPAIVSHSDATFSEWGCVRLSPTKWLPRTAGILYDETAGEWIRLKRLAGALDFETLPDQP